MKTKNKKTWYLHIDGIGAREVEAEDDIDSAYEAAAKKFKCKISDIDGMSPCPEMMALFHAVDLEI